MTHLLVKLLLRRIFMSKSQHGCTALMYAAFQGHSDCVSVLIELGADVNATDSVRE